MDASILKYMAFIKTVECGSFTEAAELLNYSQSGISRMISDLESEWKVTLLERSRSGVRLTSDGMKLLPYAESLCEEYRKLKMQVDDLNGLRTGLIRIATISSTATHWLPKIIKEFQKDYPNIRFELLLGYYFEIEQWIAEGRADCGFTRDNGNTGFDTEILERDELLAVMPEGHPLTKYEKMPVRELCKYPFILLERSGKADVSEIFENAGVSPDVRFATVDDHAVMAMVENGLGIAVMPRLILQRVPYRICTRSIDPPAYRNICFAVRDSKTVPLAVKRFSEYLKFRN